MRRVPPVQAYPGALIDWGEATVAGIGPGWSMRGLFECAHEVELIEDGTSAHPVVVLLGLPRAGYPLVVSHDPADGDQVLRGFAFLLGIEATHALRHEAHDCGVCQARQRLWLAKRYGRIDQDTLQALYNYAREQAPLVSPASQARRNRPELFRSR